MKKGFRALVAEAEAMIEAISPEQAMALLGSDGVVFVDVRERGELRRDGSVPGAVHVPRGMLEFWIDPESPYFRPELAGPARYVFFCAAGWRSALASRTALEMGVGEVCHIAGGFAAWTRAGGPVELGS
ncbi:MAG: rhodanese-like domain-containing protein [Alphaproteobacteria bacterium]|nr:rhodanese-like domain-containing protein [Alphaproteobacteria bacterium]